MVPKGREKRERRRGREEGRSPQGKDAKVAQECGAILNTIEIIKKENEEVEMVYLKSLFCK